MSRVFLTGAGFSHDDGVPLAKGLFLPVIDFGCRKDRDAARTFEGILGFARALTRTSKPDLEEFLTLYGGAWWLWRRLPVKPLDVSGVSSTLGRLCALYVNQFRLARFSPILKFAHALEPGDIVITFNWDTLLEQALRHLRLPFSYGTDHSKISVLKLHGSCDWGRLYPGKRHPRGAERVRKQVYRYRDPWAALQQYGYGYVPAISLPQAPKLYLTDLDEFWLQAYKSLSKAHRVIVIGYSMPEADNWAKVLLRSSIADGVPFRRSDLRPSVVLVSPSVDAARRLRSVTGRRVIHRSMRFGQWVRTARVFAHDMRER